MLPRGIRNNNPLNIRRGKDQWQGLRAQQTDASFCQFESLEYGWRAAFYLLTRTYYHIIISIGSIRSGRLSASGRRPMRISLRRISKT